MMTADDRPFVDGKGRVDVERPGNCPDGDERRKGFCWVPQKVGYKIIYSTAIRYYLSITYLFTSHAHLAHTGLEDEQDRRNFVLPEQPPKLPSI